MSKTTFLRILARDRCKRWYVEYSPISFHCSFCRWSPSLFSWFCIILQNVQLLLCVVLPHLPSLCIVLQIFYSVGKQRFLSFERNDFFLGKQTFDGVLPNLLFVNAYRNGLQNVIKYRHSNRVRLKVVEITVPAILTLNICPTSQGIQLIVNLLRSKPEPGLGNLSSSFRRTSWSVWWWWWIALRWRWLWEAKVKWLPVQ